MTNGGHGECAEGWAARFAGDAGDANAGHRRATESAHSMNPFLSSRINDEHRRDLLREANSERLAHEAQQARAHNSLEPARASAPAALLSVDMLLLLASRHRARRAGVAFCGDEAM